jgi:carbonic anhydrase
MSSRRGSSPWPEGCGYDAYMTDPALPADLVASFGRFRTTRYPTERERYERLAEEGQRPATMVVACSDSRSGPETVFDARPGELFVVRNVAALVPVYAPDSQSHGASAALEYAVLALDVRSIVVMGHGRCGGVAAAFNDAAPLTATDFIGTWVAGLRDLGAEMDPAVGADPELRRRELERRTVEQSLVNLRTFPWIRSREDAGRLTLSGCWFDIALGELWALGASGWGAVPEA